MIHYITVDGIGSPWVATELENLERRGIPYVLHTLRAPTRHFFGSDWAQRIHSETRPIYPLPKLEFLASSLLAPLRFGGRFLSVLGNALFGKRESARARVATLAHAFVAAHWANQLRQNSDREPVHLIHSQWIHSGGSVGMYAAWLLDVPFSFTGHAADLFRNRVALEDKIKRADRIVCISEFHRQFYLEHGARPEQLLVVYCGIDLDAYPYRPRTRTEGEPARILSIGRLVEKKGFDLLISACSLLGDRGVPFTCEIAGDGPLKDSLQRQVDEAGLNDRVVVTGRPVLQENLPDWLASGHVFAQPCVWSRDNDVDGTPRTLMEAMSTGLPSVSTRLAGIPDIIEHDQSGLLVEPGDATGLADALEQIITDPQLADRLALGGRQQIADKFNLETCLDPLVALFSAYLAGPANGQPGASLARPAETATPRQ